jgi:hypothetical protein
LFLGEGKIKILWLRVELDSTLRAGSSKSAYLNRTTGDAANAIFTAVGHNLRLVLA